MKKIAAVFFAALISIAGFAQKKSEDKRFAGLDTAFARILRDWKAAGFAVAVVEKDKIIYSRGFGYRDVAAKLPVTPNTQFAIGSCTKAFTASLLGMLEKEGRLKLDDAAITHLPSLKFYNENMNAHITLRDLMTHRTGLPRYDYAWYYFPASRDSLVQRIKYMEPTADIRQSYQYNNFMFMLQGVITEKLSGKSWEENIKSRVFQPLDMNNSNAVFAEWMAAQDISKGYASAGTKGTELVDYYNIGAMGPAGSINSSVNDMSNWLITWINGGKYKGKEILPSSYVAQAISSQMSIPGGLPSKDHPDIYQASYGLGWTMASYRGHYRVEHGGNIDGFSASTCFFPADSIGIVVLANQGSSYVPGIVRNLMSDRLLGNKYHDWQTEYFNTYTRELNTQKEAEKTKSSGKKNGTHPTLELKNYEGIYTSPAGEALEIERSGDSLFAITPIRRYWLRHFHYDVFETVEMKNGKPDTAEVGNKVLFQMDLNGEIGNLSIAFEGLKPVIFRRTEKTKPLSKAELEKYTGSFTLGGMEVKVYLKAVLHLFVPGQPEYELVPVGENRFSIKSLQGFTVIFESDDKGKITAARFVQPNGTFRAEKKN